LLTLLFPFLSFPFLPYRLALPPAANRQRHRTPIVSCPALPVQSSPVLISH
jgi:hypothetical protein